MPTVIKTQKSVARHAQRPKALLGKKLSAPRSASTAQMIQTLRQGFGVSQNLLIRLSGYSPRSIASWAKGTKATRPAETKFTELNRLFASLAEMTQSRQEVVSWLQQPNDAFDGSTPIQVIERGESDRIWRMIYFLRSGEPV